MPIVTLGDVPVVATEFGRWQGLNAPLGLTGFGVNVFNVDVGEDVDMTHDESESRQEELYVVLAGRALLTIDGVEREAGAGTLMSAPDPGSTRSLRALEDGTRILCVGSVAGTGDEGYGGWIEPA
jgi:uncharacterized cupin superfamily protein